MQDYVGVLIISFYYYYYTTSFFIIFISDGEYDSHTNAKNCSSALIVLSFLFYVTWLRFCAYIVTLSRHQIVNFSDWRIIKTIIRIVFTNGMLIEYEQIHYRNGKIIFILCFLVWPEPEIASRKICYFLFPLLQ